MDGVKIKKKTKYSKESEMKIKVKINVFAMEISAGWGRENQRVCLESSAE